jgi:hypothetical protein
MSEAVGGGASGLDQTLAAAATIGRGNTVSRKGRGVFRQEDGTYQWVAFNLGDGSGGQGAGRGGITLFSALSSKDSLSGSRPQGHTGVVPRVDKTVGGTRPCQIERDGVLSQ